MSLDALKTTPSTAAAFCCAQVIYGDCIKQPLEDPWYRLCNEIFTLVKGIVKVPGRFIDVAPQQRYYRKYERDPEYDPSEASNHSDSDVSNSPVASGRRNMPNRLRTAEPPSKKQNLGAADSDDDDDDDEENTEMRYKIPDFTLTRNVTSDTVPAEFIYSVIAMSCEVKTPLHLPLGTETKKGREEAETTIYKTIPQATKQIQHIMDSSFLPVVGNDYPIKCMIVCGGYYRLYKVNISEVGVKLISTGELQFAFNDEDYKKATGLNSDLLTLFNYLNAPTP